MAKQGERYSHRLVEEYDGLVGFGLDRKTDEVSLGVFLQMFSDDEFLKTILPRLTDEELHGTFDFLTSIIKKHILDEEYHQYFLKDR